jgi:hypothetical protein
MNIVNFDTHQLVRDLRAQENSPEPAASVGEVLENVLSVTEVATKSDIERLELRIRAEVGVIKLMIAVIAASLMTLALKSFF